MPRTFPHWIQEQEPCEIVNSKRDLYAVPNNFDSNACKPNDTTSLSSTHIYSHRKDPELKSASLEHNLSSSREHHYQLQNKLSGAEEGLEFPESIDEVRSFEVPVVFTKQGMLLLKVSHKSKKRIQLWIDSQNFRITFGQVSKSKVYEFSIDDIRSFCSREHANHYREEYGISREFEKRWLTLVYFSSQKLKLKTLNLIADSSHDLRKLHLALANFKILKDEISKNLFLNLGDLNETSRNLIFGKSGPTDRGTKKLLAFSDVLKFCKRFNINLNTNHLERLFSKAHEAGKDRIDFDEFKLFVKMLKYRPELASIWASLQGDKEFMTHNDFAVFMTTIQGEEIDSGNLRMIYQKLSGPDSEGISFELWCEFLQSNYFKHFKDESGGDDYFSHPLNEYFIMSSHNTYLLGRQIAGDASVEAYIRALQKGCRCVEIDVWNNENDATEEPIITHGRTFSNGISLTNTLKVIKKYAFFTTLLPLVISLEVHCSFEAQMKLTERLKEVFGGHLLDTPINLINQLPTPEALRHKVLIKVKKTSSPSDFGVDETGKFISSSTTCTSFSESNDSIQNHQSSSFKIRRMSSRNVIPSLSDLGVYIQGLKFRNFSLPESKTFNHCFSLSERAINSMLKDEQKLAAIDKHNRKFLMRVYPSKFRVKSSNFNPIHYWAKGCQMVATNWQTYDLGQQLNESFFEKSGGSGFILKPRSLRQPAMKSTMRTTVGESVLNAHFSISVISAQHLPKPSNSDSINPFISLEILGPNKVLWDGGSLLSVTDIVADNGFNPVWNQKFSGAIQAHNEMIFLRFGLFSSSSQKTIEDPKEIGILVVNLFDLKLGYRHLPLKDTRGEKLLNSTVFLKVQYNRI